MWKLHQALDIGEILAKQLDISQRALPAGIGTGPGAGLVNGLLAGKGIRVAGTLALWLGSLNVGSELMRGLGSVGLNGVRLLEGVDTGSGIGILLFVQRLEEIHGGLALGNVISEVFQEFNDRPLVIFNKSLGRCWVPLLFSHSFTERFVCILDRLCHTSDKRMTTGS